MSEKKTAHLTIREASRILQRSTKSLRNYVKAGKLQAEKVPGPKGPQFMFRRTGIEALAEELRLDVAPHAEAGAEAVPQDARALTLGAPASLASLVEAYVQADRERTQLLQTLADTRPEANHTIGILEERVSQLSARLKREERDAARTAVLDRELDKLKKKAAARDQLLRDLQQLRRKAERHHWWQVWRPRFEPTTAADLDS